MFQGLNNSPGSRTNSEIWLDFFVVVVVVVVTKLM